MNTPWRIGLLFSHSGATALPEREHEFGVRLAVDEINRAGGILGRVIEVVAHDPAGDPAVFRQQAEILMTVEGISVIFGCHTSDTRKLVARSVERRNGLLWYPASYEGFEYSPNILYGGSVANQCIFPLSDYLLAEYGGRSYFVGCDYIFPRETNRVMRDLVDARGGEILGECYLPMLPSRAEIEKVLIDIRKLQPDFVFSTLVGEAAQVFARMYFEAGLGLDGHRPIGGASITECELARLGPAAAKGIVTASAYFSSLDTDMNRRFLNTLRKFYGEERPTSGWASASYAQMHMFSRALEIAQSEDADHLLRALHGMRFDAPDGPILLDPDNNHVWLTPRVGVANVRGGFDVVWSAPDLVRPDPYLANSPISPMPMGRRVV
ncbi:transporter substrate-binding domain-containing protein [Paracoccus nototheniae]|uniref:Transporter substrate-binding domain-containing protein n=1 Tax=Paracoccus nototheniae TaxID=2489002 RepID=A0ABW4E4S7_9RHOB|nr:transporter substrate-binding domain-containing protein [Paracoccus nototheniae]